MYIHICTHIYIYIRTNIAAFVCTQQKMYISVYIYDYITVLQSQSQPRASATREPHIWVTAAAEAGT